MYYLYSGLSTERAALSPRLIVVEEQQKGRIYLWVLQKPELSAAFNAFTLLKCALVEMAPWFCLIFSLPDVSRSANQARPFLCHHPW